MWCSFHRREEDSTYIQQEAVLRSRYAIHELMWGSNKNNTNGCNFQLMFQDRSASRMLYGGLRDDQGASSLHDPHGQCPSSWHTSSDRHSPVFPNMVHCKELMSTQPDMTFNKKPRLEEPVYHDRPSCQFEQPMQWSNSWSYADQSSGQPSSCRFAHQNNATHYSQQYDATYTYPELASCCMMDDEMNSYSHQYQACGAKQTEWTSQDVPMNTLWEQYRWNSEYGGVHSNVARQLSMSCFQWSCAVSLWIYFLLQTLVLVWMNIAEKVKIEYLLPNQISTFVRILNTFTMLSSQSFIFLKLEFKKKLY